MREGPRHRLAGQSTRGTMICFRRTARTIFLKKMATVSFSKTRATMMLLGGRVTTNLLRRGVGPGRAFEALWPVSQCRRHHQLRDHRATTRGNPAGTDLDNMVDLENLYVFLAFGVEYN